MNTSPTSPAPLARLRTALLRTLAAIRRDDRGEGVISTAIAVLIVAVLGVGAFAAFRVVLDTTQDRAVDCVEQIGANGSSSC